MDEGLQKQQVTVASAPQTGLSSGDGAVSTGVSTLRASIPSAVWVVVRSMGEYSERIETPIRYCLSEADAKRAVELAKVEAQRDAALKPPYRHVHTLGFQQPDGSWLPDHTHFMHPLAQTAKLARKPDADEIEAQNERWSAENDAACLALGHVDPSGSWTGDEYYYAEVTLWPASGIAARSDETPESGSAEGKSPAPKGDAQ